MKQDIFEFNHIDNLLSEEEIKTIKKNFMNIITKNFGVSRKPSNISRYLMKRSTFLEFC